MWGLPIDDAPGAGSAGNRLSGAFRFCGMDENVKKVVY